ncbi:MAG TPA: hypothetical protein VE401_08990 [Solirubrobacterales bacterium]|nr:hypothetical protein [Solirubrobacterales bacterium]
MTHPVVAAVWACDGKLRWVPYLYLLVAEFELGVYVLKGTNTGTWATRQRMRIAERELARQAEAAYRRTVADWQQAQAKKKGAGATPGRASRGPSSGQAARQVQAPGPAL